MASNTQDEILARRNEQTDGLIERTAVGLRPVIDSASREIRGVLEGARRARFDNLLTVERSWMWRSRPMPYALCHWATTQRSVVKQTLDRFPSEQEERTCSR